jgi:bifunctional non-homologous end joining protein LigD
MFNGRDLRGLLLMERKRPLAAIMPPVASRVLFLEGMAERGWDLFRVACERDLEGIVGKWAPGTYQTDGGRTSWLKIKNPEYSQIVGRAEMFDRNQGRQTARHRNPKPALVLV